MDMMFSSLLTDGMQLLSIHMSCNSFSGLQRTEANSLINCGWMSSGAHSGSVVDYGPDTRLCLLLIA